MSFKKQSLIALLLISIGSSIFTMESYREPDFVSKAKITAREISDKYLGKGNFFRESLEEKNERERRERNNRTPEPVRNYEPKVVPLPEDIKLSDNAVAALNDLKINVIDKILANKSMRNEMGLLLPHEQLSRIIGEITASRTITKDQAAQLSKLRDGVMLNLKDPKIFDALIKRSKVYSQEEYNRKVKAYREVFDSLSNVVRSLNNSNIINDADLQALKPITDLISDKFDNPEDLRRSVDVALTNFKISTTIGEDLGNLALTIGTAIVCVLAVVVVVACLFLMLDGNSSGGSSSNSSSWDFFWWQTGRNSTTNNYYTNYHTNDYSRNTNSSTPARQTQQSENRQEQPNMQRKKIFGIKSTSFNNLSR